MCTLSYQFTPSLRRWQAAGIIVALNIMMGHLLFTTTPMCRDSDWLGESVSQSPGVSHEPAGVTPGNPAAVPAVLSWVTAARSCSWPGTHICGSPSCSQLADSRTGGAHGRTVHCRTAFQLFAAERLRPRKREACVSMHGTYECKFIRCGGTGVFVL